MPHEMRLTDAMGTTTRLKQSRMSSRDPYRTEGKPLVPQRRCRCTWSSHVVPHPTLPAFDCIWCDGSGFVTGIRPCLTR